MKLLLFPFGSSGDVHPFLAMGREMERRGHEVTVVVNGYFRELVEKLGFRYVESGTREEFLKMADHPDLWSPTKSFRHIFERGVMSVIDQHYKLAADAAERRDTLVVANCFGFGPRLAQEKLGVPLVTVHLQPAVLWSEYESPALPGMPSLTLWPRWMKRALYWFAETQVLDRITTPHANRLRKEMGLGPMRRTTRWWDSTECVIGMFPEWYAPRQPDWPKQLHLTEFPLWDEGEVAQVDAELEEFLRGGKSPIVFTPGSGNKQAAEFFRVAVDVATKIGERALLLTRFEEQIPCELPDSVKHIRYAPFGSLLPRTKAIVHHGGIGTASQALQAGVPQLIMPLAHDQPDNAARLKRLGVGSAVPPKRFRVDRVAKELRGLLDSPDVAEACKQAAAKVKLDRPVKGTCDRLEEYAKSRGLM